MKPIQLLFAIVLMVATSVSLCAQSYTLKGSVQDAEKVPLIGATVVVLSPVDSVMSGFGITNADGAFSIERIKQGDYSLQITYVGFGTFQNSISVSGDEKVVDLGMINLANDANLLDAVEIKGKFIPMVVKKDTVEYNADAYRVRPNANVEELLKKMPGIDVSKDGTITAQGEEVNKVTVDGKQFFGKDPKAATKNLPADAIKKVQVFDEKSKKSQFTGVSDGADTKTINLELKEDKKRGYFGTVSAGYGTSERLESKLNVNTFGPKMQLSGIVGYNNINKNGFSFDDYQDLVGDVGFKNGRFNSPIQLNFGGRGNGDSKNLNAGLNFNYDISKKSTVSASYYRTDTDNNYRQGSFTEYRLANNPFSNRDTSNASAHNVRQVINTGLDLEINDKQRLFAEFSVNIDDQAEKGDQTEQINRTDGELVSITNSAQNQTIDRIDYEGSVEYDLKLGKKGRVFSMDGNYGTYDLEDSLDVYQALEEPTPTQLFNQYQLDTTSNNNLKLQFSYQEPIAKDQYLKARYKRSNYSTYRIKDVLNKDVRVRDYDLSRASDNTTNYDDYGIDYKLDKPSIFAKVGLTYHKSYIGSEGFLFSTSSDKLQKDDDTSLSVKTYDAILPEVSLRLLDKSLRLAYETSINEPSVNDLQTLIDNTNPNRIRLGNPALKPEYRHNLSARYHKFDRFTFRSIFSSLRYAYTERNVIDSVSISDRFVQTQKRINGDGAHSLSGYLSFSSPIKPLYIKARLSVNGSWQMANNYVDNQLDKVQRISPSIRLELENLNNDYFTLVGYTKTTWNNNYYDINNNFNSKNLTQSFGGEFIVEFGKGFTFDTEIDYNQYFNEGDRYNSFALWNANISKTILDGKLTLTLRAYDILDQNKGIDINQTATSLSRSFTNTLQRYFMFSASYKFSSLGGVADNPNKIRMIKH